MRREKFGGPGVGAGLIRGWKCPDCGRVYGPAIAECRACNTAVDRQPEAGSASPQRRLPTPSELRGSDPDFTGGLESVEYLRRLREGTLDVEPADDPFEEVDGERSH